MSRCYNTFTCRARLHTLTASPNNRKSSFCKDLCTNFFVGISTCIQFIISVPLNAPRLLLILGISNCAFRPILHQLVFRWRPTNVLPRLGCRLYMFTKCIIQAYSDCIWMRLWTKSDTKSEKIHPLSNSSGRYPTSSELESPDELAFFGDARMLSHTRRYPHTFDYNGLSAAHRNRCTSRKRTMSAGDVSLLLHALSQNLSPSVTFCHHPMNAVSDFTNFAESPVFFI